MKHFFSASGSNAIFLTAKAFVTTSLLLVSIFLFAQVGAFSRKVMHPNAAEAYLSLPTYTNVDLTASVSSTTAPIAQEFWIQILVV